MSAKPSDDRGGRFATSFVLLPETVFDCSEGQAIDPELIGGLVNEGVLLPTTEFDCGQPSAPGPGPSQTGNGAPSPDSSPKWPQE